MNQAQDITMAMSPLERRASFSLALIFACRMLGLFMILPVFSLYAEDLPNATPLLIGFAISAYGLTQALLQIPFGMLSDHFGRKKIIALGLILFAAGSVLAALSDSIYGIIAGRALQGCGAIAAAVMALAADLTREEHRTKAMASIGISIGISFSIALVAGPVIANAIGINGIFWLTAGLALVALVVLFALVPNPARLSFHSDTEPVPGQFRRVLKNSELLRLDVGILALHLMLTATFVTFPLVLRDAGVASVDHWLVYLPVMVVAIVAMVPFIIIAEKKRKMKIVFLGAITVIAISDLGLFAFHDRLAFIIGFLFLFFTGFNLLEATLPSMISKIAPAGAKGTAMGVYSSSQFIGAFLGGIGGGWIYGRFGVEEVFLFCSAVALLWLIVAWGMRPPLHVSRLLLNIGKIDPVDAVLMEKEIATIAGVADVSVSTTEGVVYLKVDQGKLDRESLDQLVDNHKV